MVQTVASRNLIVHKDLALGVGLVEQTRSGVKSQEQQIEMILIFRTKDEIRYIDVERYTRVALHNDFGPLVEYAYDATATGADDDDEILAPLPLISLGRWLKVVQTPPAYTTAELNDISSAINVSKEKQLGYMVFNSDLSQPVWALNTGGAALWVDANGTTVHTPS